VRAASRQELLFDHAINEGLKYGKAAAGFGEGGGVLVQLLLIGSPVRKCVQILDTG
jgi:hypothetical protein